MEGGIFTVVGGLILVVLLAVFPEFSQQFRLLTPIEQALTRAGNGFALMTFLIAALWWPNAGPTLFGESLPAVLANPGAHWGGAVWLGLFIYGGARFNLGVRQCRGVRDAMLASRGFMKLLLGGVGAWLLRQNRYADIVASNGAWAWLCLLCVAL